MVSIDILKDNNEKLKRRITNCHKGKDVILLFIKFYIC